MDRYCDPIGLAERNRPPHRLRVVDPIDADLHGVGAVGEANGGGEQARRGSGGEAPGRSLERLIARDGRGGICPVEVDTDDARGLVEAELEVPLARDARQDGHHRNGCARQEGERREAAKACSKRRGWAARLSRGLFGGVRLGHAPPEGVVPSLGGWRSASMRPVSFSQRCHPPTNAE